MWIDSVIEYDIIVETLTGAEIEVTVTDDDTIGYIKTHIQKYEGKFQLLLVLIVVDQNESVGHCLMKCDNNFD